MSEHNDIKQMLSLYIDGELTPQEQEAVKERIASDPVWQKYYQEMSKLSFALRNWPDEELSPDLEQTIRIKITKKREDEKMRTRNHIISVGVGASAAVAIVVLTVVMQGPLSRHTTQLARIDADKESPAAPAAVAQPTTQLAMLEEQSYRMKSPQVKKEMEALQKPAEIGDLALRANDRALGTLKADKVELAARRSAVDNSRIRKMGGAQTSSYDTAQGLPSAVGASDSGLFRMESRSAQYEPYYLETNYPVSPDDVYGGYSNKGGQMIYPPAQEPYNREQYDRIYENPYLTVMENPLSTFSIDVDTASYSNIRRFLNQNQLPPKDAVRIEEMINYFVYDYPQPKGQEPFSITTEVAPCPWNGQHQLALIGLQGKELTGRETPPSNLVFLIDVSGSMNNPQKLPLLKQAFRMMVNELRPHERIAIVTYAGRAGLVLDSTPGNRKAEILAAIDSLQSGGSTAGAQGITLAYQIAQQHFIANGNNRVILATDGDFNVGVSSDGELVRLIEEKKKQGVFLTVLGFGTGNYQDAKMEKLADKGNGNYYYIDTINEAQKVLVHELGSTLFTIAKDVKIQIEFNPQQVKAYRLIGYENRILAKEDFNDDTKDAGELGAGHTVTALYEIVPVTSREEHGNVDPLRYVQTVVKGGPDMMTVKLRYKRPDEETSRLITESVRSQENRLRQPSNNLQFASAVAEFGLILRDSQHKGNANYNSVLQRATSAQGHDAWGYRAEFIGLVQKAQQLDIQVYDRE